MNLQDAAQTADREADLGPGVAIADLCRLCGGCGPLQNSHILPEFVYTPIYDANHKGYMLDPLDPEQSRKFQKGLRERMLCHGCEQFLNDEYEKPFKKLWFDQKVLSPLETSDFGMLQCGEYARFKLFHMSVLLRAELATLSAFREARVGPGHRERLVEMVRLGDPGLVSEYPVVCFAIERPGDRRIWWDLVSSPNPGRVDGMRFYEFTFGGCSWMYFVASHRVKWIEDIALRADGALPARKKPLATVRRFAPYAKLGGA